MQKHYMALFYSLLTNFRYMKKLIFLILIFSILFLQSQIKSPSHERLLEFEKRALYFEYKKDYNEALRLYYQIKSFDSLSDLNKRSNDKIDYLLPICRKETVNKLKGKWKLKKLETNDTNIIFTQLIQITDKEINFIEEDNGKEKIIASHSLSINPFVRNRDYEFPTIKFGENEIWILSFREINNEKRLIWERKVDKNGDSYIAVDERELIKGSIERKNALEDELDTYYIKIE